MFLSAERSAWDNERVRGGAREPVERDRGDSGEAVELLPGGCGDQLHVGECREELPDLPGRTGRNEPKPDEPAGRSASGMSVGQRAGDTGDVHLQCDEYTSASAWTGS